MVALQELVANHSQHLLFLHLLVHDVFIFFDFIHENLILIFCIVVLLGDLPHVGNCPENLVMDHLGISASWSRDIFEVILLFFDDFVQFFELILLSLG
jgi:hypothetical protein